MGMPRQVGFKPRRLMFQFRVPDSDFLDTTTRAAEKVGVTVSEYVREQLDLANRTTLGKEYAGNGRRNRRG